MQKERYQSQINQNFGTVCHKEVLEEINGGADQSITKHNGQNLQKQTHIYDTL